jgi:hypothetical protein
MLRVQLKLAVLAAAVLAASAAVAPAPAHAKNNTAAIVGGIIAGAAVGAAISSSIDHPKKVYVPGPPPRPAWDKVYKPNNNIWCYPAQRACYNRNGVYDAKWTYKVYAR